MESFFSFIDDFITENKIKNINSIFECIEQTINSIKNIDEEKILNILESNLIGIKYSYLQYKNGKIKIPSNEGLRVYKGLKYIIEDLSEIKEQAEKTVKYMNVNGTGVRPQELITGTHGMTKNAVMRIIDGIIPPMKDDLEKVRMFPELWNIFIAKLSKFEFFSHMSPSEKTLWILEHEKSGDYDMAELDYGVKVEILDVGNSKFIEHLTPDQITEILESEKTITEIRSKFPFKPGSKGLKGRPTLMFYLHFWKIFVSYEVVSSFNGLTFDIRSNKLNSKGKGNIIILEINKEKLGIILDNIDKYSYFDELLLIFNNFNKKDVENIEKACKNFTAAGYKSLLQKIIRYAPLSVLIGEKLFDSDFVLSVVFTLLLSHPGSFVPDIQRFVTGQESAIKRLTVAILEDSSIKNDEDFLKLGIMAFLSQRISNKIWYPNKKEYKFLIEKCIETLNRSNTYIHNIKKGFEIKPFYFSLKNTFLQNFSALLDDIRSFATDLAMTRFIAYNKGQQTLYDEYKRPEMMKISHCIDQHWAPELIYYLPVSLIEKYKEEGSKPFAKLFKYIFMNLSGINARREGTGLSGHKVKATQEFIDEIEKAQDLTLIAKQLSPKFLKLQTKKNYNIQTKLDISWISGLIGPISVPGKPPAMVTLKPNDPYQLVAIRKPSRGMKDGTLSDERSEQAIDQAKKIICTKGMPLNVIDPPINEIKGYKLKIEYTKDQDIPFKYFFQKGKIEKTWDEIANINIDIPIIDVLKEENFDSILKCNYENGILKNAFKHFEEICNKYDLSVLRRLLSYINSYRSIIEISRLSKDGGGTSSAVVIEDVGACQLLLFITYIFPSALKRIEGYTSKFKVYIAPLLWQIRDFIRKDINKRSNITKNIKWPIFKDTSGRTPYTYQIDCLNEMIEKNKKGGKGHFLWLNVGLGKTLIVLYYLKYLRDNDKLPLYIIYTLPKTALNSIIKEIEYFGIPINLLIPIKSWKKKDNIEYVIKNDKLVPNHINIIEHDHLRFIPEELISKVSDSILIIDEVHKALNDTKRTSVALELSRLSIDFIALTGTPVVDTNTYKLIWWLEQVVNFEVNDKNFWVSANGMIAKKVNTGIEIDKKEIIAKMTDKEHKEYSSLISPIIGGTNSHTTAKDIQQAFELCYDICDRELINQTLLFIKEKKGVMLIVRNYKHQQKIKNLLIKEIKEKDIFCLQTESIFMTDESVKSGETPDYKVVIVPLRKSEGYTLTRLKAMVTGVYPSAEYTREQLEGRINRLSQHSKIIYHRIVHCGILTYVLQKHKDARSISEVLSSFSEIIN